MRKFSFNCQFFLDKMWKARIFYDMTLCMVNGLTKKGKYLFKNYELSLEISVIFIFNEIVFNFCSYMADTVGVGATNPGEKRTYGNFVASDTLMPLKAQLITPPLKSMPNDNTSTSTDSDPPPPPPPPPPKDTKFQTASTVTTTETPPPPPPPPTVTPTGPTGQKQRPPIVHQIGTVGRPIGKQQSPIVRQQGATVQQPSSTGQQQASTVNQQPGPPGVNPVVQAIVDNALGGCLFYLLA